MSQEVNSSRCRLGAELHVEYIVDSTDDDWHGGKWIRLDQMLSEPCSSSRRWASRWPINRCYSWSAVQSVLISPRVSHRFRCSPTPSIVEHFPVAWVPTKPVRASYSLSVCRIDVIIHWTTIVTVDRTRCLLSPSSNLFSFVVSGIESSSQEQK